MTERKLKGPISDSNPVFISYARADGWRLATRIRNRLKGVPVWQDVIDIHGGEDWWLQIEDRIRRARSMVLVLSPGALASVIVRREWICAHRAISLAPEMVALHVMAERTAELLISQPSPANAA